MPPHAPAFWMVCRSPRHAGAKTEPRQRYASLPEAQSAARDLARANDAPFVILAAVETVWPRDDDQKPLI